MRLSLRIIAIVASLLLTTMSAFGGAAPICDVSCVPDPTGAGYDATVLSMSQRQNMRGKGSIFGNPAADSARVTVQAAVIPGSQSYSYVIPIAHLPGRNGLDLNLNLYYNSRVWNFDLNTNTITLNTDRDFPTYGFRLDFGFIELDSTNNEYALVESDGTKRQMTLSGSNYVTTDSSFIQWTPVTATLVYKNGSRGFYELVPGQTKLYRPIKIEDTNGNFIGITYESFPNGTGLEINEITDTIGRKIDFKYDGSNRLSSIAQAGTTPLVTYATFAWTSVPLNYNFTGVTVSAPPNGSVQNVLQSCTYANGTKYVFTWGDWAIITQIQHQSSSNAVRNSVSYDYPTALAALSDHPAFSHETVFDGQNTGVWTYSMTKNGDVVSSMSVTDFVGTTTTTNLSPSTGLVSSVVTSNGGRTFRTLTNTWSPGNNPTLTSVLTTLGDSNQQARTDSIYDSFGNPTDIKEYDFGLVYARHTTLTYQHAVNSAYATNHVLNRPSQIKMLDASETVRSRTDLAYDTPAPTATTGTPVQWDSSVPSTRGNLTTITMYGNPVTLAQSVVRNFTYDTAGNLIGADLDCCNHRAWTYDLTTNFAYPVTITTGLTAPDILATTATYDLTTGLMKTFVDENGKTTTFVTYDNMLRLRDVERPDGVHLTTDYDDSAALATVTSKTPVDTGSSVVQVTTVDGNGNPLHQTTQDAASNTISIIDRTYDAFGRQASVSNPHASGETPVFTTTNYDVFGRVTQVIPPDGSSASNFTGYSYFGNSAAVTDPAGHQRKNYTDAFGRLTRVDEPGGSPATGSVTITGGSDRSMCDPDIPPPHCITIWDTGSVSITVNGVTKSADYGRDSSVGSIANTLASEFNADPNAPVTATVSNATINFTSVESGTTADYNFSVSADTNNPDFAGPSFDGTPSSGALAGGSDNGGSQSLLFPFVTHYAYDPMNNLTNITQGAQQRGYVYDGISRLLSTTTPESGSTQYTYATFGAVSTRTDARGVITTYGYDGLNRLKQITYNVGSTGVPATAAISYTYGTSSTTNNVGRLLKLTDGLGSETYSYDVLGRTTQVSKLINGHTFNIGYSYNQIGEIKALTYPSGRVVSQVYDAIGRLQQIASGGFNYLTIPAGGYNSASLKTSLSYGNGVQATIGYNARLQLSSVQYVSGGTTMLGLTYSYNQALNGANVNNGQITQITDATQPGRDVTYTYDQLARLKTAVTAGSTSYPQWGLTWTYDRYGNRTAQTVTAGSGPATTFSVDETTNRFIGDTYDANGNLTLEGGLNYSFIYDGDNHLVNFDSGTSVFNYDGHGLRVQKLNAGTTTTYIFDRGNILAEYLGNSGASTPAREFIYADGQYLATISGGTTTYYHSDRLSIRLQTKADGTWSGERGHFPFGEAWYDHGTFTKNAFTNYKRETESFTDYAYARYYSNRQGRFMMVDRVSGTTTNPQTWNRYTYVGNDPLNFTDGTGLIRTPWGVFGDGGGEGGCEMDGVDAPCDMVSAFISGGGAVQCPANQCTRITTRGPQYFWASTNGPGLYYNYSGPGSLYYSVEQAGEGAVEYSNPSSIKDNQEYSGNLYLDQNGVYSFTPPNTGGQTSSPFDPTNVPAGTTYAGSYHDHGSAMAPTDENFSPVGCNGGQLCDVGLAMSPDNVDMPMFLGTPGGRVEVFYPGKAATMPFGCVLVGSAVPAAGGAQGVPTCK
jgi:RHS repeat-associated protein